MPLVSVIIPVYNGARTLPQCLDSVLQQDYASFEVVVVDNASTDTTSSIVKALQKRYPNLLYVFENVKSIPRARNIGVANSSGDIIAMTDSDCVVPKNWLTMLTASMRDGKEQMVMGADRDLVGNALTQNIQQLSDAYRLKYCHGMYIDRLDTKNFGTFKNILSTHPFDESFDRLSDFELSLRLRNILKIRYVPETVVGHYHTSSLRQWIKKNYYDGYWIFRIFEHYRGANWLNDDQHNRDIHTSIASYVHEIAAGFDSGVLRNPFFAIVTGISWRVGGFIAAYSR